MLWGARRGASDAQHEARLDPKAGLSFLGYVGVSWQEIAVVPGSDGVFQLFEAAYSLRWAASTHNITAQTIRAASVYLWSVNPMNTQTAAIPQTIHFIASPAFVVWHSLCHFRRHGRGTTRYIFVGCPRIESVITMFVPNPCIGAPRLIQLVAGRVGVY